MASYKDTVKSFKSLSVSSLNRFLNCSNSFYFDNVLKLTTAAGLKPAVKKYANKVEMKHKPTGPCLLYTSRQFVLEVANPDGAKLYFCGNYVMGTTQIEVASIHGVAEGNHAEHGHD